MESLIYDLNGMQPSMQKHQEQTPGERLETTASGCCFIRSTENQRGEREKDIPRHPNPYKSNVVSVLT